MKVYLDNAATTFVSNEVFQEMVPCFNAIFGNSSSIHSFGREANAIVDRARDRISKAIGASKANEIYFTSSGTEANNWALKGIANAYKDKGKHIIVSQIEHDSIMETCKALEKEGFEITYLPVNAEGIVSLSKLYHHIRKDTILVSVMTANNEVGTVQNIKAMAKTCHEQGVLFHTDATQALGAVRIDVKDMEIDVMTISSHKVYGPKGVGALYIKNGVKIEDLINGGSQERGKRGGTSNVPGIAGFGKAVEIATRDLVINQQKLKAIRNYFLEKVNEKIPNTYVNGHPQQKLNGLVNMSFECIEGESILMLLDFEGIAVSTGSACTSGSLSKSHVLYAMGVSDELSNGSVRFSFGKGTTKEEVDYVVEKLAKVVQKLRNISPLRAGRK